MTIIPVDPPKFAVGQKVKVKGSGLPFHDGMECEVADTPRYEPYRGRTCANGQAGPGWYYALVDRSYIWHIVHESMLECAEGRFEFDLERWAPNRPHA